MHLAGEAQLVQYLEEGMVGNAVEMVIALDGQTIEIEMRGHAADTVVRLENHRTMPVLDKLIGNCQSHGAGTEHGDALIVLHQNSSTTLL